MVWSYAAKSHVKLLIQAESSTIRQIINVSGYVRNFHVYKEIDIPRFNHFIQYLNKNFYLVLEN